MLKLLLRMKDLKKRRVFGESNPWKEYERLRDNEGFPTGKLLTPKCRVWEEDEINSWLASRPVELPQPLIGAAKLRVELAQLKKDLRRLGKAVEAQPPDQEVRSLRDEVAQLRERLAALEHPTTDAQPEAAAHDQS